MEQYDFTQINWNDLRNQKRELLEVIEHYEADPATADIASNLDGIIHLIDSLQDYATDVLGYSVHEVFDMEDEDPDN